MFKAFETHRPARLYVEIGRGSVTADATNTSESTVEITGEHSDQVIVEQNGDQISVLAPKIRTGFFGGDSNLIVNVVVPTHSELAVKTGSADIRASGTWSTTQLKSGSGQVEVDSIDAAAVLETGSGDIFVGRIVEEARIKSGSGDIQVKQAGSSTVVATGSGDVEIGQAAGPTVVKTGSGDLRVATADGDVSMSTGSGDAVIERLNRGKFSVKGASGDVAVGIPAGIPIWTDISSVSGRVRSDLDGAGSPEDGQDYIELRAKTVSGDITLKQL
jgi:DUF4097 and DUF4098 domain-containing protein YvlB